ncbi:phenazine biosynthesis protein [filamentous cyanobacterium CCT1]|nr:phenazine biosynthesis protein [filamentous cyanobacterium CCT1]PSN79446.1 phenazine biosynthesis protein [filamentous cyanobacterium CCP4]
MAIPLVQVAAFTDVAFSGNPAAVCALPEARPDRWMQQVAQEMNLSETAFFYPEADGYRLRWFTLAVEEEDPVTGSAHCCLSPYWREKLGKTTFLAHQASARGGVIKVADEGVRVRLSGQAVTVLKGNLLA